MISDIKYTNIDMLEKNLIIFFDYTDLKSISTPLLKSCDRLAVTPGAMLALEQSKLAYATLDSFYDCNRFRTDNIELIKSTEKLLSTIDKKYELSVDFPRSFTGNIQWFLALFTDIYYISMICEKINNIYRRVYFVGDPIYNTTLKIDFDFSSQGLIFKKFNFSLASKIGLFKAYPFRESIWINTKSIKPLSLKINFHRPVFLFKRLLKRILYDSRSYFNKKKDKRRTVFIIQDGYEVAYLKKYMHDFVFVNPISNLLDAVKNDEIVSIKISKQYNKELEEFVLEWFPKFQSYIFELFDIYHERILCRLKSFQERVKEIFNCHKPLALFYSRGANRVYEDICAFYANKSNIPIYYFQHGGTPVFIKHFYQKYLERNYNIKKIDILQSKVEKEFLAQNDSFEGQALGSIKLYNLFSKFSKANLRRHKKILYCAPVFNFYSYRTLMHHVSDKDIFVGSKEILNVVNKFQLDVDIKTHPCNEEDNYLYFKNLLRIKNTKNAQVLRGFAVEKIIENYDMLILDFIVTALFPVLFVVDIPVIIYLKDVSYLQEETLTDMEKRFYLARNRADLERYIDLYYRGELKSKFSLDIIDRYAFPIDKGDIGEHVSTFIKNKIAG